MATYHEQRTAQWGNWGISFADPNPDAGANYGLHAGWVYFPVGTRGPMDADKGKYRAMIADWIAERAIPEGFIPA